MGKRTLQDGKCYDGSVTCSFEDSECPTRCAVDEGLASSFYLRNPELKASARSLIDQGAKVLEGAVGHLCIEGDGRREVYAPNGSSHYLQSIVKTPKQA